MFIVLNHFMNFFFIGKIIKQEKHIKCSYSAFLFFGCKNVGLKDLRFTKPAYTQKNQHFDAKSAQNLHILKKTKVLIVKSHQTCIYSKNQKNQKSQTLCGTDWHRWIGFWCFWFFWVYAGLVTFHYQNFWFFWIYAGFVHFWHQNVDLFWVYAGLVNLKSLKPAAYTQKKTKHFDREKLRSCIYSKEINILMPKVHKTCIYSKKSKTNSSMPVSPT